MRPRLTSPGDIASHHDIGVGEHRFNEAQADQPGRSLAGVEVSLHSIGLQ